MGPGVVYYTIPPESQFIEPDYFWTSGFRFGLLQKT